MKLKALSASTVQSVTSQKISCLAGAAPWMDEGMIRVGNRVEAWILCMSSQHMFLCNNCDLDTQRIDFEECKCIEYNAFTATGSMCKSHARVEAPQHGGQASTREVLAETFRAD